MADTRVHGITRRQAAAVFEEERKALGPLSPLLATDMEAGLKLVFIGGWVIDAPSFRQKCRRNTGRRLSGMVARWRRWSLASSTQTRTARRSVPSGRSISDPGGSSSA